MSRQKLEERSTRKLIKKGDSYVVTLPIDGIRELKWKKGQKLTVEVDAKRQRMVIRDWK